MKKLMIAAAIVCAAVVAQAASVSWATGNVYISSDATGTVGSGNTYKANAAARQVNAYVYVLASAEEYATASAMSASELYAAYVLDTSKSAEKAGATSAMGSFSYTKNSLPDGSTESPQHLYSVFILEDVKTATGYDGVDAFVMAKAFDSSWQDTVGVQNTGLAGMQSKWTAYTATTPVPEPTSGLLMLLGVAGLALRRRRA